MIKLNLHSHFQKLALILCALLAFRLTALFFFPWGLHGDEAQYWAWAQDLDFGYFSKPPMIAWLIAFTTGLFGDAEWAVRLSAPFLHIATSLMIFLSGRRLFNSEIGFWAALIYTLMPAVWLSSYIMSTDASLLLCWAIALHAWACLRDQGGWIYIWQLGLALGFGLLSKYAMAFMIPVIGLAILFDKPSRKALLNLRGGLVLVICSLIIFPNIFWNMTHEFATLAHTAENTNLEQDLFHPEEVLKFWGDQFGVFGLLPLPMLLIALLAAYKGELGSTAKWVATFSSLPLILITAQALLSRANANWAVTAYVAAPILVAIWASQTPRRLAWLKWGLVGQTAVVLVIGSIASHETLTDSAGVHNSVKRLRAWPETAAAIQTRLEDTDYAYVAADNRLLFYSLNYYGAGNPQLKMWSLNASPAHHANLTQALPATDGPILILSHHHNFESYFRENFQSLIELEPIKIDLGPKKTRYIKIWRGIGYKPTTREDRH